MIIYVREGYTDYVGHTILCITDNETLAMQPHPKDKQHEHILVTVHSSISGEEIACLDNSDPESLEGLCRSYNAS